MFGGMAPARSDSGARGAAHAAPHGGVPTVPPRAKTKEIRI